jgi:hypothetical protein
MPALTGWRAWCDSRPGRPVYQPGTVARPGRNEVLTQQAAIGLAQLMGGCGGLYYLLDSRFGHSRPLGAIKRARSKSFTNFSYTPDARPGKGNGAGVSLLDPSIIAMVEQAFIVRALIIQGGQVETQNAASVRLRIGQHEPHMARPKEGAALKDW